MARPRQVSDTEILEVARKCFLEHGPGVSTSVIAEALNLSQAALFKRFGTKNALLLEALMPNREPRFFAWLEGGPSEAPLREQLLELSALILAFFEEMVPCMSALRASGISPEEVLGRAPVPMPVQAHSRISIWLEQAAALGLIRPELDCQGVATVLLGSIQARSFISHVAGRPLEPVKSGAYLDCLVDLMIDGIVTKEGA